MYLPHPESLFQLPLYPIPLGCPRTLTLGAMLHASNLHWSSVLHMVMYMFQCFSFKSPHPYLLPLIPKVYCLCLCLFCCPACRIVDIIFLNSYIQYLPFSFWLTSLCIIDSRFIHFIISEVAQSCPTLCEPMDCSLLGSSVHGIFQARVLEWVAISFSRGSSWPRDRI